jgi:hypothetical protein
MTEYILKPLNCINDANGNTFRPFELNGEVIFHYPLNYTMADENVAKKEIMKLCIEIRNRTGIELVPEDIPKIMKNGGIIKS